MVLATFIFSGCFQGRGKAKNFRPIFLHILKGTTSNDEYPEHWQTITPDTPGKMRSSSDTWKDCRTNGASEDLRLMRNHSQSHNHLPVPKSVHFQLQNIRGVPPACSAKSPGSATVSLRKYRCFDAFEVLETQIKHLRWVDLIHLITLCLFWSLKPLAASQFCKVFRESSWCNVHPFLGTEFATMVR